MDLRVERIAALKKGFDNHPSAGFLGARLESLEVLSNFPSLSISVVTAVAKREFMVHSDMPFDLITQGGLSFAIANFAGVYAAMVHTKKHTPLFRVNRLEYSGPIKEGDEMVATACAWRQSDLIISTEFWISVDDNQKFSGSAYYFDLQKK